MSQEMATTLGEGELLLLQETAAMNTATSDSPFFNEPAATADRFSHLHLHNRPPCASCGSHPHSSFSFGSHKRPSPEDPTAQPNPKKPNNCARSLFGFSKIPLSSSPLLRRCSSDPYSSTLPQVVEDEPPLSPPRSNAVEPPECPVTPLSNAIAANKLPPRPPSLKRCVSDPVPSPSNIFSNSSASPHAEWVKKMRDCMLEMSRKWDEILGDEEDTSNEDKNYNSNINGGNGASNNDETTDNCNEGHVEAVSVQKKGEAIILHFKCPCRAGYQVLLVGGNCYYKLI